MKRTFSRTVTFTPEWEGNRALPEAEQIKATIKPLVVDDLMHLMDALGSLPKQEGGALDTPALAKALSECKDIIPKYVTVSNLEDADGPVSLEDITRYPAYLTLAVELLMEAARVSMPSESAEGNSAKPPA
jgi:hypothetical protein